MRASKFISTISYNTDEFLLGVLNGLIDDGFIDFWAFINHLGDTDDKKAHKHLLVRPAHMLDTDLIKNRFNEVDLLNPGKLPLGVKMWCRSKFVDWYLYALHDEDYLSKIGQVPRNYHYRKEDIIFSDESDFNSLIFSSDFSKYENISKVRDSINSGVSFAELVRNGHIPIQQIYQWKEFYKIVNDKKFSPFGCGGGSSEGAPFMGAQGEPVQGELLSKDFDSFVDSNGEVVPLYPVYGNQYSLPFDDDSE